MSKVLKRVRSWVGREDGNMTVEFVILVPLFVIMISGTFDLSRIYVDQANYYSVARDTARVVARHGMSEDDAKDYAVVRVSELSNKTPTVNVATSTTDVTVTISAPVQVLGKFGFLDFLNSSRVIASATHALEPV